MTAAIPSALRRKTARTATHRTVAGVRLTKTDLGYEAQGWRFELVESTPPYWIGADGRERFESRSLDRLVGQLVTAGDLKRSGSDA
jgi:hypothetical protein